MSRGNTSQNPPTVPRSRPSIHQSSKNFEKLDTSNTSKHVTTSKDDSSFLKTPESSFNPDGESEEEIEDDANSHKTSNTETEEDEKNSEESNYSDNEDSIPDARSYKEFRRPFYENEGLRISNFRDNSKVPNLNPKPVLPQIIKYDDNRPNLSDTRYLADLLVKYKISVVGIILLISMALVTSMYSTPNSENIFDINILKTKFTTQENELWIAFESGVRDVLFMNRPSTFILLYKTEAEGTLKDLLYRLSKYAICNLTHCSKEPLEVSSAELNSKRAQNDYGVLIEDYRHSLEEKGVMIIKNLENVHGVTAQAFHSICDEFTPLVRKSLIIFTMKVDKLPKLKDRMKFVEEYLKNKWTDIKVDTRNALITRITSMVMEIKA